MALRTGSSTASLASLVGRAAPDDSLQRAPVLAGVRQALFGVASVPRRIDRFEVLEVVGRGAFGVVYAAFDPELDRRVALKVAAAFDVGGHGLDEARAAAGLNHPNVVTVYGCGYAGDRVWVAMELVEGQSLREHVRTMTRSVDTILPLFLDAAEGLVAAHAAGLVHRDFKPDNVLVGDDGRVRVVDFGLAVSLAQTRFGATAGTPAYMAPEQLSGRPVDGRADQFSFCVSLFEALVGHRPFTGRRGSELLEDMRAGLSRASAPEMPRRLFAVIRRGVAFDRAERYPSMTALRDALRRAARPRRRLLWLVSGATIAVVALGSTLARAPEACDPGAIEDVWGPAHVARLPSPPSWGRPALRFTVASLDEYAAQWSSQYELACRSTSKLRMQWQRQCLEEARLALTAVSDALSETPSEELYGAHRLLSGLPPLQACATEGTGPLGPQAPDLAAQLARAEVRYAEGRYAEASDLAADVMRAGHERSLPAWEAKAETLAGVLAHARGDPNAIAMLEGAVWRAQAAGETDAQLRAATVLVYAAGLQTGDLEAARRWSAYLEAEIERAGGSVERRIDVAMARGLVAFESQHHHEALRHFDEARRLMIADGFGHASVPDLRAGAAWADLGDFDRAIELQTRAHDAVASQLGPEHPELEPFAIALAQTHAAAGQHARAVELFEGVQRRTTHEGHGTAILAIDLAASLRELGRLDEARRSVERALAMTQSVPTMEGLHASASLELARVMLRAGELDAAEARLRELAARPSGAGRSEQALVSGARRALAELQVVRGQPE